MYQFFETIKINRGFIHNLLLHEKRLNKTVIHHFNKKSNISLKNEITPPQNGFFRCKIYYHETISNIEYIQQPTRVFKSFRLVCCDDINYEFKYANRSKLEELNSLKNSCDDILIIKNSLLTDTTIANVAIFLNNCWITPKKPLFKGVMYQKLVKSGFLKRRNIKVRDIKKAQKIAIMNALVGFLVIDKFKIEE